MKKKSLFLMVIAVMTCCLSANAQVVTNDPQEALTPEQIQQQQATREAQLEASWNDTRVYSAGRACVKEKARADRTLP